MDRVRYWLGTYHRWGPITAVFLTNRNNVKRMGHIAADQVHQKAVLPVRRKMAVEALHVIRALNMSSCSETRISSHIKTTYASQEATVQLSSFGSSSASEFVSGM
jgi:hypothetical protein